MKGSVPCGHCQGPSRLICGAELYPHRPDLADRRYWRCDPCDAHVGCHQAGIGWGDGTRPLGAPANPALRRARMAAHAAFDSWWQAGSMTRNQAYAWLARRLRLSPRRCHIACFDEGQCEAVMALVTEASGTATSSTTLHVENVTASEEPGVTGMALAWSKALAAAAKR